MTDSPRGPRNVHGAFRIAALAGGLAVALSTFYAAPSSNGGNSVIVSTAGPYDGTVPSGTPGVVATESAPTDARGVSLPPGVARSAEGLSCPGNNGNITDQGVDAKNIWLASTEVRSGIGSSFLGSARYGMLAVVQKQNRLGGVCGRQIRLKLQDDAWRPDWGQQYLKSFILGGKYLAFAVVPSSNGLDAAGKDIIDAEDKIRGGRGIPVIGSDGMLNSQYASPWIWPVAASTATTMRIMARDAVERGKKRYPGRPIKLGIVYDRNYPFGVEGAGAFAKQAARDGAVVPAACIVGLTAGQTSYATQVKGFNDHCSDGKPDQVDFVGLLLEPQTGDTWLGDQPFLGTTADGEGLGFGGPQPLFDIEFSNSCGQACNNLVVWTSLHPPVAPFVDQPAVQTFKNDLCAVDGKCEVDALNAFTEGAYVGMTLVVEALKRTSPFITRERLRQTLDSMTFETGLTAPLTWRRGNHFANNSMIAFRNSYASGAASFQYLANSQREDPCAGCADPPLED